jgi:FSR family fosmidomycin resistance protein-like MFS transporter
MLIGLAAMVYLYRTVPLPQEQGIRPHGLLQSLKEVFGPVWLPIVLIWLIMTLRAYVSQSFLTYLPLMYSQQGHSLVSIGALVSLFTVAGAISGLLAGHISDRIGFRPVFIVAHLFTTPCMYMLLYARGIWIYPSVFLTGFFVLATLPLGVALAQKLAPQGKSMASSLMMGLAYGMGGVLTPLTGKLADYFTIPPVLSALALIPVLSIALVLYLFSANSMAKTESMV